MSRIFLSVSSTLGMLLALSPRLLFPVCCHSNPKNPMMACKMACFSSGRIVEILGALIVIISVVALISASVKFRKYIFALNLIFTLIALAAFTIWPGVCKMASMSCVTGTKPAVIFFSTLLLATSIVGLFFVRTPAGD